MDIFIIIHTKTYRNVRACRKPCKTMGPTPEFWTTRQTRNLDRDRYAVLCLTFQLYALTLRTVCRFYLSSDKTDGPLRQYTSSLRWAFSQLGVGGTEMEAVNETEGIYSVPWLDLTKQHWKRKGFRVGNPQGFHVIVWIAGSTISPTIDFAFLFRWVQVFNQWKMKYLVTSGTEFWGLIWSDDVLVLYCMYFAVKPQDRKSDQRQRIIHIFYLKKGF